MDNEIIKSFDKLVEFYKQKDQELDGIRNEIFDLYEKISQSKGMSADSLRCWEIIRLEFLKRLYKMSGLGTPGCLYGSWKPLMELLEKSSEGDTKKLLEVVKEEQKKSYLLPGRRQEIFEKMNEITRMLTPKKTEQNV
jgi:hypothetical protein